MTSAPNLCRNSLMDQRQAGFSEVQHPMWSETLYSTTAHGMQKTIEDIETKEKNRQPRKKNTEFGTKIYNHFKYRSLNLSVRTQTTALALCHYWRPTIALSKPRIFQNNRNISKRS